MLRCTSGLLSRCSSFRLLQGAFLEVSPELTAGLETQHNNQELPQPGMFPCRKWSLKGSYSSLLLVHLYSQMSTLAVSPRPMCMAYPAQHGDSQGVMTGLNHSGPQIRPVCLLFFQSPYKCSVSTHWKRSFHLSGQLWGSPGHESRLTWKDPRYEDVSERLGLGLSTLDTGMSGLWLWNSSESLLDNTSGKENFLVRAVFNPC